VFDPHLLWRKLAERSRTMRGSRNPRLIKPMRTKMLLGCALFGAAVSFANAADSLLKNGEFAKPIQPWKVFSLKETPATSVTLADGVATIQAEGASEKPANRQMVQAVDLESGKKYRLDFDAKAEL